MNYDLIEKAKEVLNGNYHASSQVIAFQGFRQFCDGLSYTQPWSRGLY